MQFSYADLNSSSDYTIRNCVIKVNINKCFLECGYRYRSLLVLENTSHTVSTRDPTHTRSIHPLQQTFYI